MTVAQSRANAPKGIKPGGAKVFHQVFLLILLIVFAIFGVVYFYSVPLIKQKVFDIERNSSQIALNNVYELANRMHAGLEEYKSQALAVRQQQLKTAVSFTESFLEASFKAAEAAGLDPVKARQQAFAVTRDFRFGDNEYVWIADYDSVLVSHPDPEYQGQHASAFRDRLGQQKFPGQLQQAIRQQESFFQYTWKAPGEANFSEKVAYLRSFPQWRLVIGASIHLDEIDSEVKRRSEHALTELRAALSEIRVAQTGYFFVFDSNTQMLIHPNANIDGTVIEDLVNPVTRNSIAEELIKVADTGRELYYKWDKPSDPGNYVYEKLSQVRYMAGLDWYISSSVYVDELQASAELLSRRILTIAFLSLLLLSVIAFVLLRRITQPIAVLAKTARRIRAGDLNAQSGIRRRDEIGLMAESFDAMVRRLKTNIDTLDSQVQERTRALTATEQRLRLILDALPAQISYCDRHFRYLFVNKAYADQFAQDQHEIVGRHFRDVLGDGMYTDIYGRLLRVLAGESVTYEYSFEHQDRTIVTKRRLLPEFDEQQHVTGILSLSLDVTAEKEAQRRLNEAQRMQAVGQLAGGMAHDFNNLLSIIQGNLMLARDRHGVVSGLEEYLLPAIKATRRGAEITHRMLAFSRRQSLHPAVVDVNALIAETRQLLDGSMPSNIRITTRSGEQPCLSYVDSSHLENALVNLCLNARDAMPEGGDLCFGVSQLGIVDENGYDEPVATGDYVLLSVSDNGRGFEPAELQQAYEPFYSTKSGETNSGLGLSMVYGFVKQSGGYIGIDSAPGEGACINILLPAATAPLVTSVEPDTAQAAHELQGKLLLLVEDNNDVRRVVREQLVDLGIQVVEAEDAEEALQLMDALDGLDGMVSDIVLRDSVDGIELARRLRKQRPDALVLLISGYSFDAGGQGAGAENFPVLRKPFESNGLLRALLQANQSITIKNTGVADAQG